MTSSGKAPGTARRSRVPQKDVDSFEALKTLARNSTDEWTRTVHETELRKIIAVRWSLAIRRGDVDLAVDTADFYPEAVTAQQYASVAAEVGPASCNYRDLLARAAVASATSRCARTS